MLDLVNSLPGTAALFALAAAGVWFVGSRLSYYADEIADRYRIGKALTGLVLLATATSLPEIVTTMVGALAGEALLVLNNLFGGITLQTALLAVADVAVVHAALSAFPRKTTPVLEGTLLALLLLLLAAILSTGDVGIGFGVGLGTLVVCGAYLGALALLQAHDKNAVWTPIEVAESEGEEWKEAVEKERTSRLITRFAAASALILVLGVALVLLAERLAVLTGLGQSFVGATLLAATTSLPELTTTIAAVRIRSYTLAISNIFGSNLIMLALVLPADILYRPGPILDEGDRIAGFALLAGAFVTLVYVAGLVMRSRRRFLGMGIDSVVVLLAYLATLVAFYRLR